MERYMSAAERIARWAISTEIPAKPLEVGYLARESRIRRLDRSTIEAEHRVEFAGEYIVRFGLPGERPPIERSSTPRRVTLGFWMDGKLLATQTVETKPSGLVYFNPYSEEEFRLYLPEGDHVFRAGFIDDGFVKMLPERDAYRPPGQQVPRVDRLHRTVCARRPRRRAGKRSSPATRESGRACVEQILTDLARRAYRRPPTRREIDSLAAASWIWRRRAVSPPKQGMQLAIQAMLVSPNFLFRIERDPDPRDPALVHEVSPFELASRVSYFLWSSMPDDELLTLAESGQLRDAARARGAGRSDAGRPARRRRLPRTSPASGSRRATSMSSSRIRTSSRSGTPSCAKR